MFETLGHLLYSIFNIRTTLLIRPLSVPKVVLIVEFYCIFSCGGQKNMRTIPLIRPLLESPKIVLIDDFTVYFFLWKSEKYQDHPTNKVTYR